MNNKDTDLIPIAIRSGHGQYVIAYQLAEPQLTHWSANSPASRIIVEVSSLKEDDWTLLGEITIGTPFQVPEAVGPVPLFRTRHNEDYVYIGVRKIDLEGATNFRDIGGYLTKDHSQLRFGRIFRSDNLANLTLSDWKVIDQLGVGYIIDLRRMDEKVRSPTVLPSASNIQIIEIPIDVEILGKGELLQHILSREITKITHEDMAQMYQDILSKFRPELTRAVAILLDPTRRNKIVHCTAGKDRTGLIVALVQALCNIPQKQIMSDFLLSNSFRTPTRIAALSERLKLHQVDIEDIVPYLSASRTALIRAFEVLRDQYDGPANYLALDETFPTLADKWQSQMIYRSIS